jgi:aminoglycoside phosphotransferase (APT) family kinase protein
VIDWEDAKLGDPLADLAYARLEMLWAFGDEGMERFTEAYRDVADFDLSDLPYQDLIAALKPMGKLAMWAGDANKEQDMQEKHGWFVEQALAKLAHG